MTSDRIELGVVARAAARRDGRPNAAGRVIEALSVDEAWHFYVDRGYWSVEHLPSRRVLSHAGTSLEMACSSEGRLLAELDRAGVPAA